MKRVGKRERDTHTHPTTNKKKIPKAKNKSIKSIRRLFFLRNRGVALCFFKFREMCVGFGHTYNTQDTLSHTHTHTLREHFSICLWGLLLVFYF